MVRIPEAGRTRHFNCAHLQPVSASPCRCLFVAGLSCCCIVDRIRPDASDERNLEYTGKPGFSWPVILDRCCFLVLDVHPGSARIGYSFRISRQVVTQAAINFAYFAAIAIPSSLAMHFTRWNPRWTGLVPFLLSFLEIFIFIAVLEELFFRGFLQSLLSKSLRSWVAGQTIVSVLFGLFHILHPPVPNWRYVALATVAGWFYGSAFRKTGSLMTSSLMHAAVDTVWRTWLSAR